MSLSTLRGSRTAFLKHLPGLGETLQRAFLEEGHGPVRVLVSGVRIEAYERQVEHRGGVFGCRRLLEQFKGAGQALLHPLTMEIQIAQVALCAGIALCRELRVVAHGLVEVRDRKSVV